jgi:hypothetical protein
VLFQVAPEDRRGGRLFCPVHFNPAASAPREKHLSGILALAWRAGLLGPLEERAQADWEGGSETSLQDSAAEAGHRHDRGNERRAIRRTALRPCCYWIEPLRTNLTACATLAVRATGSIANED